MPRSRSAVSRSVESDDALLSSRLDSLDYSLSLPPAPATEPLPVTKPLIEQFMEQVEADIRRMNRERGLVGKGEKEAEYSADDSDARSDSDGDSSTTSSSSSPIASFSLPEADADLTLHDLLKLVKLNKKEAAAAKKAGFWPTGEKEEAVDSPKVSPPSTPSEALKTLKLSSSSKPQTSPSKRRRASSPPRTPPRTPSSSPGPSPSLSPSPCKRVALRKKSLFGVLSLCLTLAGAAKTPSTPSTPPLVATIARLCEEIPDLTLPALVDLAQSLRPAAQLLETASERTASNGRIFGSSLNFLGKNLFSTVASPPPNKPLATLLLSRALDLYPSIEPTSSPALPLPPAPRILSTRHAVCVQCASPLTLRNRQSSDNAHLADTSSPAAPVIIATHTCGWCGAVHAPDHVEVIQAGRRLWLWDDGADAFKVGERVWISISLARHYSSLLLEQAISPGGFSEFWNGLYAPEGAQSAIASSEGEEEEEEEEDDGYIGPTPAVHIQPTKPRKNHKLRPFTLRPQHVWRAFVLFSCFSAVRSSSTYSAFVSLARPPTEELVALANRDLFGTKVEEVARVLPPHTCEKCTRKRRRWKGGPATEEEKRQPVRWAGSHEADSKDYVEDTKISKSSSVQLAVCDGIQIGHPLCAYPSCTNPPQAHRRAKRFCHYHEICHTWCGIIGCERPVSDELGEDNDVTEACKIDSHQEAWRKWKKRNGEMKARGWAGRKRKVGEGIKYEVVEVEEDGDVSVDEEEGAVDYLGDEEEEKKLSKKRLAHMWNLRRSTNLQILVGACGTPLAWAKFAQNEHPSEVVSFLSSAQSQLSLTAPPSSSTSPLTPLFPSYIAYDRACHVLRSFVSSSSFADSFPPFLSSTRLIVTAFHRQGHSADDAFCSKFCDPTPLNGEAPDLVVPYRKKTARGAGGQGKGGKGKKEKGSRTFERAFNTTAAEQLNSTLSRFAPLLSTMRADNFDFVVHVLLRHRAEDVKRKREKGKGRAA